MTHVNPNLVQAGFRGHEDDGAEGAATVIAAENTNWTQAVDVNFRVRFVVDETAGGGENNLNARLQYNLNGAGWNDVDGSTSLVVRAFASAHITDEGATTRQLTSGSGTFITGAFDEADGLAGSNNQIDFANGGEVTEVEYCVQIRGADVADTDTVELRVVRDGGSLEGWTQTPAITASVSSGTTVFGDAAHAEYVATGQRQRVTVEPGIYRWDFRVILKSGVVLYSADRDGVWIWLPRPLDEAHPEDPESHSYARGFLEFQGGASYKGRTGNMLNPAAIATITANAARLDAQVTVDDASGLSAGQRVRVTQVDPGDRSLIAREHGDFTSGGSDNAGDRGFDWVVEIQAINGTTVTLDRPIPLDIETQWSPTIREVGDLITEAGVEGLTFRFKHKDYAGHGAAEGFNAIELRDAIDCWVRDCRIVNSDYGVHARYSHHCTIDGVLTDLTADRGAGGNGHHGITITWAGDNLVKDCAIDASVLHDITVSWHTRGNVVTRTRGADLNLDFHAAAPYGNLFTEIDFGAATRAYASSGSADRLPHAAQYNCIWMGWGDQPVGVPDATGFGPRMTVIGTEDDGDSTAGDDWHVEFIDPGAIQPRNLWEALS